MKRTRIFGDILLAGALVALVSIDTPALAQEDSCGNRQDAVRTSNLTVLGLTSDGRLVRFKECAPESTKEIGYIVGLGGADTALVGIDFRVQDGGLYGVGNGGGVYLIDASSGIAVKSRQLTVALDGTSFGVDFNPAANALRIISNTGQNLRLPFADPAAATATDLPLNYTAGTTTTGVAGAAYVNNDLSAATGTVLFDIDSALDQVVVQLPPNNGSLARTGSLSVDSGAEIGFDIYTKLRAGVAAANKGLASLVSGGITALYRIDPLTGTATFIGPVGDSVVDIALPLSQTE